MPAAVCFAIESALIWQAFTQYDQMAKDLSEPPSDVALSEAHTERTLAYVVRFEAKLTKAIIKYPQVAKRGLAYKTVWQEFRVQEHVNFKNLMAPQFWADFIRCYPDALEDLDPRGFVLSKEQLKQKAAEKAANDVPDGAKKEGEAVGAAGGS